ncbi:MAG: hypothetical protein PUA93_07595 [Eubacteriales bacterium]|nr:hypothetical protein [Eubacteriales bacterium]
MNRFLAFVKKEKKEILLLFLSSLLLLLLSPKEAKSGYFLSPFSFLFSCLFLYLQEKDKQREEAKRATYAFCELFFHGIRVNQSLKVSYEIASRYLVGYQPIKNYEDERESPSLSLLEFQDIYLTVLEKDKENEATLLTLREVEEEAYRKEKEITEILKKNQKREKMSFFLLFLLLALAALLFALYPPLISYRETGETTTAGKVLSFLLLLSILPAYELSKLLILKESNHGKDNQKS